MIKFAKDIKVNETFIHSDTGIEYKCLSNHVDDVLYLANLELKMGIHFFYDELDDIRYSHKFFNIHFNDEFVITNGTIDSHVSFWKKGNCGYVSNLNDAAIFTLAEAQRIIDDSNGKKYKIYPLAVMRELTEPKVHCHTLFDYDNKLKEKEI